MGEIHNDLATWAGKARARGQDTISLDIETADMISDLILEYQEKLDDIKNFVEDMEKIDSSIPDEIIDNGDQGMLGWISYKFGYIDAINVMKSKINAIMVWHLTTYHI